MTRKTEPASGLPDAPNLLQDLQAVRVSHIVDPIEAEQDKVEGTAREHVHRSGIAHGERDVIGIGEEASPAFADHLAGVIHDEVLQSLGLALLQTELCRRLWENGQGEDAASELAGVVQELESAVDALRGVMADLRVAADAHVRAS